MKNGIKTFLIIGILFSNITTSHARQPQTVPMLKGCILSHQLDTLPSFKVYFNGAPAVSVFQTAGWQTGPSGCRTDGS